MKKNCRKLESMAPHINSNKNVRALFLLSPSDIGVRRNGGRNGARYAPKAIINLFQKFNNHFFQTDEGLRILEVTTQEVEKNNFHLAQDKSSNIIQEAISKDQSLPIIHIGGGHDHIFPLLQGLDKQNHIESIVILNIDAHCDTRVDETRHSGTPFRDYDLKATKPFHLIQFGLQKLSNSKSTLTPLLNGSCENIFIDTIEEKSSFFTKKMDTLLDSIPFKVSEKTHFIISLDCDAISGTQMKAVSAVNARGIPSSYIHLLINQIKERAGSQISFGIYEFNPIFDDLSNLGNRTVSTFIYDFLK